MPEKKTLERAKEDKREGKSASTQAGEFVRKRSNILRKESMGLARLNGPSRLVFPRRAALE